MGSSGSKQSPKQVYVNQPQEVRQVEKYAPKNNLASMEIDENSMQVVAILDMSGSMQSLTNDTIAGFNTYLDGLKEIAKSIQVTLIVFNDRSSMIWEQKPLKDCSHISAKEYHPNGGTALTDAMGIAITNLTSQISNQQKKPGKISFFVTTDGEENSSRQYSQQQVKEMIVRQTEEEKWDFIFAGANIDAFKAGQVYGIQQQNIAQIDNDALGQKAVYQALAADMKMMACESMSIGSAAPRDFQKAYKKARMW